MKYIVIDLKTGEPLYGIDRFTLLFYSDIEAINLARQFFRSDDDFAIYAIKLK